MTKYQEAYNQVEQEIKDKEIAEIKLAMQSILQLIEEKKQKKEKLEDELRVLKLELDDLRAGKLDKIKSRHESEKVRLLSPLTSRLLNITGTQDMFDVWTSGAYSITNNGKTKIFYF